MCGRKGSGERVYSERTLRLREDIRTGRKKVITRQNGSTYVVNAPKEI